jgi:hypothetical protein
MAQVTVTIKGASRAATLSWGGDLVSLTSTGGGNHTAAFQRVPGNYLYVITVFGAPGDAWSANITDGIGPQNHAGHMSPGGFDGTGDTAFQVH